MSTSVGGPPVNQSPNESINNRTSTIPAIPNGNSNNFSPDHSRKPSMTVTPAGASFNANGATQNKASNIQFGSVNAAGSPAMNAPQMVHQSSNSLGVNLNPRASSPQGSPSPIPQPVSVSGGRPPSNFQGQANPVSFGQMNSDGNDANALNRPMSNLSFNEHARRGSSQSVASDMGNPNLPTGPTRGNFPPQAGRGGRGGYGYQNPIAYSPHQNFRPAQNGRGMGPGYQGQGRHQIPYQGSPNLGTRSPMMNSAAPGTPQMNQMHMMPAVQGQPGYYMAPQGYGVATQADPSIQYMYNMNAYPQMQNQFPYPPPQQSPRPPYQQPVYSSHMQPTFSNQGPPSMSRQSSQMSATDRPSSGIGQTPHTPGQSTSHASARTPSMSAQKSEFTLPTKKSAALVIKNAAGEVLDFKKQSTPSTATPATSTPAIQTPPSRTPSANDHARAESVARSDEEKKKAMQEAVAKKLAEDQARAKQESDQRAQIAQEAADAAEREAEEKAVEAKRLEQEAQEAQEEQDAQDAKEAQEAESKKEPEPKAAPADDEVDFDAIEAELAALEAEEARKEEEYQKKKATAREAQRKKEEEEAAAYEANMKEAERKAEELEVAREKKRAEGGTEDSEGKRLFAALKGGEAATPVSTADDSPAQTPAESGAVTPVSDSSMPPPSKAAISRRPKGADLTLDTKKTTESSEPSATLNSLLKARRAEDPMQISYPEGVSSPNSALIATAAADRKFKYNTEFLLQFQNVFKEKPTLDWDVRIRDSLGDGDGSARPNTARTPSGMGGRNPSNRGAASNAFTPMGAFGGRPPLGAGTTSEQRFAASNAVNRGAPMANNPFAFGRPGSMGPPMGRTPSNNPMGSIPGSPRPGGPSRGGQRNESKRAKQNARQEADANKNMPLTVGLNITALETSGSGWKPHSLGHPNAGPMPGGDAYLEPDAVQRKVKAALNKMTPEKFDKIADQILEIAAQSKHESDGRTLRQVIQLTFEKATDEAHWAPMYAMFCSKMLHSMSLDVKDENIKDKNGDVVTGGNLFRKYLLNRCQEEFERGWKVNLPPRKEGETEEAAMLSDEYYQAAAAKRRGLGLVKFIGELFKLQMLTERIMHECVKKLVDYEGTPEEAEVESLVSLLRTIGKQLDSSESKAQGRMDVYFERIKQTMAIPDLPSRLQFMLMDIVDLRRNGWVSKQDDKGPKTITEIREEAERKAREAEMQRLASQAGGRGGGRMPMGRGDARSFSGYGQVPPPDTSNRVGADDLRRLGGRSSRNASSTGPGSLGPPSLLAGRTNSGRRGLGPGGFLSRGGEDSNASSRTGTPPAQKDKDKKDESSTNAFSALAALDGQESHEDPSSPPPQKVQPSIERERSRSPEKAE